MKFTQNSTNITEENQEMLWNLPHNATDHIPGKFSICVGMPVMIKRRHSCGMGVRGSPLR